MSINDMMKKASHEKLNIRIVDIDGKVYEGKAGRYSKADDEENGYSTLGIATKNDGRWRLAENEIISIEKI